ncbi:MAG: SIR2 family protein [Nitrospirae bacterium]|nr:SIR2 family protein [Fimbriimonadaceae bacterium]
MPLYGEEGFTFPEPMVRSLVRREALLVIGSGVSASAKDSSGDSPPTWGALLSNLSAKISDDSTKKVVEDMIKRGDFLTGAEVLGVELGDAMIKDEVVAMLRRRFQASEVHEFLSKLGQSTYVSLNYDTILDTHMRDYFDEGVSVKHQRQDDILADLRQGTILLIKAHGTIDDRDSIVLTRSQYAQERVSNSKFYRILDALFLTRTVIFVGCGLHDPDVRMLMEDGFLVYPGAPEHYMIKLYTDVDRVTDMVESKLRNLKFVYYGDSHDNLVIMLRELVERVESHRSAGIG